MTDILALIYIVALTLYLLLVKGIFRAVFQGTEEQGPLRRAVARASVFAIFFGFGALGGEGFALIVPSLPAILLSPWRGLGSLEFNLKALAVSWAVLLFLFVIREIYVERRDAGSNRRYTGGPVTRTERSFDLGNALAAFSMLVILTAVVLLVVLFGIEYLALVIGAILIGSLFTAWIRRLRRGRYKVTVDTPGLVSFETDLGRFQVNSAHARFQFAGKKSGTWPLEDIRYLEFEATQRWSVVLEFLLGWNPTDLLEEYRDRMEYFVITLATKDGRNVPLYVASQIRPREFLMGWSIRLQEMLLGRLGLYKDGYRHSQAVYLNLVKIFRAAGVALPDAETAMPLTPPESLPKTRQTELP